MNESLCKLSLPLLHIFDCVDCYPLMQSGISIIGGDDMTSVGWVLRLVQVLYSHLIYGKWYAEFVAHACGCGDI